MTVKLARHTLPSDPTWVAVRPSVPLGTLYTVVGGSKPELMRMQDRQTGKCCHLLCYLVWRVDKHDRARPGYMPVDVFEIVP
jgi:hypothetical protein